MTRTEIATQVLAANPHVVEDALMQEPTWVKDTSLEFADAILKAERRMLCVKIQAMRKIKEAYTKALEDGTITTIYVE
jgi:hypothetical protein